MLYIDQEMEVQKINMWRLTVVCIYTEYKFKQKEDYIYIKIHVLLNEFT